MSKLYFFGKFFLPRLMMRILLKFCVSLFSCRSVLFSFVKRHFSSVKKVSMYNILRHEIISHDQFECCILVIANLSQALNCNRVVWDLFLITNFSDHKKIWTVKLFHSMQLLFGLLVKYVYSENLPVLTRIYDSSKERAQHHHNPAFYICFSLLLMCFYQYIFYLSTWP